jgi:hypothetical protein
MPQSYISFEWQTHCRNVTRILLFKDWKCKFPLNSVRNGWMETLAFPHIVYYQGTCLMPQSYLFFEW